MLSERHKAALRAGRESAAQQRQADEDRAAQHYIDWTRVEAEAYGRWVSSEAAVLEYRQRVYREWRSVCAERPVPPPDAAFRRLRGEL